VRASILTTNQFISNTHMQSAFVVKLQKISSRDNQKGKFSLEIPKYIRVKLAIKIYRLRAIGKSKMM
jgi:hypothetical protein